MPGLWKVGRVASWTTSWRFWKLQSLKCTPLLTFTWFTINFHTIWYILVSFQPNLTGCISKSMFLSLKTYRRYFHTILHIYSYPLTQSSTLFHTIRLKIQHVGYLKACTQVEEHNCFTFIHFHRLLHLLTYSPNTTHKHWLFVIFLANFNKLGVFSNAL